MLNLPHSKAAVHPCLTTIVCTSNAESLYKTELMVLCTIHHHKSHLPRTVTSRFIIGRYSYHETVISGKTVHFDQQGFLGIMLSSFGSVKMLIFPRNWQAKFQLLFGMKSSGFWDISLGQIESGFVHRSRKPWKKTWNYEIVELIGCCK